MKEECSKMPIDSDEKNDNGFIIHTTRYGISAKLFIPLKS
jgi:hypothetical protein